MSLFSSSPVHEEQPAPKKRRGFAAMNKELQRFLSSKGGKSQGKASNPGNFARDPMRASAAGRAKSALS